MLRISVVDFVDGQEVGRKNYPSPVCVQICGCDEALFTYLDASGVLNTVKVDLRKQSLEIF